MTWPLSRRALGLAAAIGGLLAAFAGSPFTASRASIDVGRLTAEVVQETDRVSPIDLADWIRDRRAGLRVIDLRPAAAFDEFHLPTAESLPLASLPSAPFNPTDTIVLYAEGSAQAAQAWVFLRALGHPRVFFLRGGVDAWMADVMNPTLPEHASPAAEAAFARQAEISRYFGGVPRRGDPGAARAVAPSLRRQGC